MISEKEIERSISGCSALGAVALALSLLDYENPEMIYKAMQTNGDPRVREFGYRMEVAILKEELKKRGGEAGQAEPGQQEKEG